jgi:hypothetical protein
MRPGMELDSIRLAVLMVSPKSVYLDERKPDLWDELARKHNNKGSWIGTVTGKAEQGIHAQW